MAPLDSDTSLRALIRTALQVLRAEHPEAFAALKRALGRAEIYLHMNDGETLLLRCGRALQVWSAPERDPCPPAILTSRHTILRLLDGELTILEAVYQGDLEVFASPEDLLRLEQALGFYLRGAVRCPSFPGLLERFRKMVSDDKPFAPHADAMHTPIPGNTSLQ